MFKSVNVMNVTANAMVKLLDEEKTEKHFTALLKDSTNSSLSYHLTNLGHSLSFHTVEPVLKTNSIKRPLLHNDHSQVCPSNIC